MTSSLFIGGVGPIERSRESQWKAFQFVSGYNDLYQPSAHLLYSLCEYIHQRDMKERCKPHRDWVGDEEG